jgi:hypothetical protein
MGILGGLVKYGLAAGAGAVAGKFFSPKPGAKKNPLSKLDQGKGKEINVQFPSDEMYLEHHINFRIFETNRENRNAPDKKQAKARITLPMPMELTIGYNAQYAEPELGAFGAMAADAVEAVGKSINSSGSASEVAEKLKNAAADVMKKEPAQQIGSALISGAMQALGGEGIAAGAAVGLQMATGAARNPHKAVLFQGTNFRTHTFNFRLSPVTRDESDHIRTIVNLFKYHMTPGYITSGILGQNNNFFAVPEFFQLEFSHPSYLFELMPCILKDFNVNYQPQNYPAYARPVSGGDPAPMEVVISLSFQEIEIITKQKLQDPYAK